VLLLMAATLALLPGALATTGESLGTRAVPLAGPPSDGCETRACLRKCVPLAAALELVLRGAFAKEAMDLDKAAQLISGGR
jgi:hypothetical protein